MLLRGRDRCDTDRGGRSAAMMVGGVWTGRNAFFGGQHNSQSGASTREPGLDRPQVDTEDVRDLFVGKTFNFAQHDDGAEGLRNVAQSGLDTHMEFLLCSMLKGRASRVSERRAER